MDGKWLVGRVVVVVGDGGVTDGAPDWSQEAAGSGRRDFLFFFSGGPVSQPEIRQVSLKKRKNKEDSSSHGVCWRRDWNILFQTIFKKGIFFCHFYFKLTSVPCLFFFLGIDCKIKS
jgi:hypothetical protein